MDLPLGIKPLTIDNKWKWTNVHGNFTVPLKEGACFELSVSDPEFEQKYPTFYDKYNKTTENFQWLIKNAIDKNLQLRAMGSGWSLSKCAVSNHGIINTKKLRLKLAVDRPQVAQAYLDKGGDPGNLVFVQCGNTVIEVNELLEKISNPAKSLRASGGSNGQTVVGALSTGTHGAAYKFGSLSEFVVGLHIVVGPNRHVWLERASYPVTSKEFRDKLKAEVIIDDGLFYSALCSFGSFGIIHGIMIEVEPKFLLEQDLKVVQYNAALEKAMTTGDFTDMAAKLKYPLNDPNNALYHFEMAINPHTFQKGNADKNKNNDVYLRVMYKQPYRTNYTHIEPKTKGHTYGDDLSGLIQVGLDKLKLLPGSIERKLIPKIVNSLFKTAYDRPETAVGTVGETFKNTIFRGRLFSAGYAFDSKAVPQLIDMILELNKKIPFAGVMGLRFVKGTKSTLGFTKFENTCVLELDGVDAQINHDFLVELSKLLESKNIDYGMHWGKINTNLNKERVRKMYGSKIDIWLGHRKQLLSTEARNVFNNWFLENCGLDKWKEELA